MFKKIIFIGLILTSAAHAAAPVVTVDIHRLPLISDASIQVRKICPGTRPNIERVSKLKFKIKYVCKNELRRVVLLFKVTD